MARLRRAIFLAALIGLPNPALAQFWPWSQPNPPKPPVQTPPPPQNFPPPPAAPAPQALTQPAWPQPVLPQQAAEPPPVETPPLAQTAPPPVPLPKPAPQPKSGLASTAPSAPPQPQQAEQPPVVAPPAAVPRGGKLVLDQNQRELVNRVSLYLSSVQTLVGDFVQVAPGGSKSQGQFYIQKPGRVRFEYDPPSPIAITADGRQVSVLNRKLETQDLFPLSQTPLRFLLSDHIDLLREATIIGVYSDDVFATIILEERNPLVGTSRLMMMFDAKDLQLKQWTVTDAQGYDTTVAVYNLDYSTRPDPTIFTINAMREKN